MCTHKGLFHLECTNGSVLAVSMYFTADAKETVISPTDIVLGPGSSFDMWWQVGECRNGTGTLPFSSMDGLHNAEVRLRMKNKLWYVTQGEESMQYRLRVAVLDSSIVRRLTVTAVHDLWHHCLGHPGTYVTNRIAKSCDGVPLLRVDTCISTASCAPAVNSPRSLA